MRLKVITDLTKSIFGQPETIIFYVALVAERLVSCYALNIPEEDSPMNKLIKSIQLVIIGGSVVFFVAGVKHGNAVAAESSSQEDIQIIPMSVERAAHQSTLLTEGVGHRRL